MPDLPEDRIAAIVDRVVQRLGERRTISRTESPAKVDPPFGCSPIKRDGKPSRNGTHNAAKRPWLNRHRDTAGSLGKGLFASVDEAVAAATSAFERFVTLGLQTRRDVIEAIRHSARGAVQQLAEMAVSETGLGRVDQKVAKNSLVIDKTPGPEILEPWARSGDDGLTIEEWAPYGVIGAITPTTNPTETILCNAIGMLAAGNAVVFNVHPSAREVSAFAVELINEAVVGAGGPPSLVASVAQPTIDSAKELMVHPGIRLLVVTGGPGVVAQAMRSGKTVIAGGPGNPPVVGDETADLEAAADGIVRGVALDNNIVCCAEKEIIAVASIADRLQQLFAKSGAYLLNAEELQKVTSMVVDDGHPAKEWVGKDATNILAAAGINAPAGTLIALAEVSEKHPLVQLEMLMPVVGMVRVPDIDEAIAMAVRCERGCGHTASIWSRNIDNMHRMARAVNTSIFVKNAPNFAGLGLGGEGFTSFTIASPTGEGLTTAVDFARRRRSTLKEHFRIV